VQQPGPWLLLLLLLCRSVSAALQGEPRPHHKSVFDFDEKAMPIAASILVQLVVDLLCVT
jgi:metal-dependent amidase/aminoacylase/carboxypeptidase family protein